MKLHPLQVGAATREDLPCLRSCGSIADKNIHVLNTAQVADNLCIDPWNGFKLPWPVCAIMRPAQPCCVVRFPLSGHAVAKRAWSWVRARSWLISKNCLFLADLRFRCDHQSINLCVIPP